MTAPSAPPIAEYVKGFGKPRATARVRAAATYARQSRAMQQSIPEQQELTRRYVADRLGLPLVAELSDVKSGLRADRPGYQELLRLARAGRISHVCLFRDDRIGRDDLEYIGTMRELEHLGVEVHDTLSGKIEPDMVGLKAWLANKEVRTTSARVLPLMQERVRRGQSLQRPPLGYEPHRDRDMRGVFVPSKDAPLISDLFRKYAAGEPLVKLAASLSAATGKRMSHSTVRQILSNPYYCGTLIWGRENQSKLQGGKRQARDRSEWVYGRHDYPIIDEETWTACQVRLQSNQNVGQERQAGPAYALSGLAWCATCAGPRGDGQRLTGRPANNGTTATYWCRSCGRTRSTRRVEAVLREMLQQVPIGAESIAAAQRAAPGTSAAQAKARAQELTARMAKLVERRRKLTLRYADDEITRADYDHAIAVTDAEMAALQREQDALGQEQAADASTAHLLKWLQGLDSWTDLIDDESTIAERNDVYRLCLKRLTIDFTYNTVTVTWQPAIARLLGHETQTASLA